MRANTKICYKDFLRRYWQYLHCEVVRLTKVLSRSECRVKLYKTMVCIICFDVLALIRLLKCNRSSREVIKLFNYSAMTACSLSLAKFISMVI